jgi:hypothetical protein
MTARSGPGQGSGAGAPAGAGADAADAIPAIACSLDTRSLADRVDEWHALLATAVASVEVRSSALGANAPGGDGRSRSVRLVLHPSEQALVSAASLGQREKQCCAFFDVAIEIEADRRSLVLSVPPGAEEALASFVALLTS